MKQFSNPADNPVWHEVGDALKPILRSTGGSIGILLIERNGAVAVILAGDASTEDRENTTRVIRLFQKRLEEMADHAENGDLDLQKGNQTLICDTETGNYIEKDKFNN